MKTQTATLETADPTKNLILVPLSQLVSRPSGRNVRKHASQSIDALAASIARVGLLQNLTVILAKDGEYYEVVAGGRRLAALKLLAKKRRIPKTLEIPCLLVADATARTASLTENVQRETMHPADQFEAFAALMAEGITPTARGILYWTSSNLAQHGAYKRISGRHEPPAFVQSGS